jgi:hypothetical protein
MKKILITMLSAGAMVASSFAQSQITFQNSAATAVLVNNGSTTTKMFGSVGTYDFGLYMGASGTSNITQMQLVDLVLSPNAPLSSSFNAGLFSASPTAVASPGNVANTINFAAGTQYSFMIAGWAAAGGSNYNAAVSAGVLNGLSVLGFITPTSAPSTPPNLFGVGAGQVGGFTLNPGAIVPEPATLAIGGLGAAALLMFRRRK